MIGQKMRNFLLFLLIGGLFTFNSYAENLAISSQILPISNLKLFIQSQGDTNGLQLQDVITATPMPTYNFAAPHVSKPAIRVSGDPRDAANRFTVTPNTEAPYTRGLRDQDSWLIAAPVIFFLRYTHNTTSEWTVHSHHIPYIWSRDKARFSAIPDAKPRTAMANWRDMIDQNFALRPGVILFEADQFAVS